MVTITFPDRETEKRALAFLLGRFPGRALRSGEHLVPDAALAALASQNISFTVKGTAAVETAPAKELTSEQPLPSQKAAPEAGAENAASIALLQSWLDEDATDDPEEIRKAQEELDEFKQAINAERERAGARQIYP